MLLLVGLFAWAVSGRRLLRVRRVPAWRSATIGVEGADSYTAFGYANPTRRVLADVLHTRAELREVMMEEDASDDGSGAPDRADPGHGEQDAHLRYASDVMEVVETYLYRPALGFFMAIVTAAKRLQSGPPGCLPAVHAHRPGRRHRRGNRPGVITTEDQATRRGLRYQGDHVVSLSGFAWQLAGSHEVGQPCCPWAELIPGPGEIEDRDGGGGELGSHAVERGRRCGVAHGAQVGRQSGCGQRDREFLDGGIVAPRSAASSLPGARGGSGREAALLSPGRRRLSKLTGGVAPSPA